MDPRDVQPTSVRGLFFRQVPAGSDPLFQPEHPADGRWQRGEIVEGFYLAGSEQTAWGEWYRALAKLAVPPMRQMPRDLWRFAVHIEEVADLSNANRLAAVGLPSPVPTRSQWPRFQAVGEALSQDGWPGLLYPSASRAAHPEGNHALCLFRHAPRIAGAWPVNPPTRYEEPPAPSTSLRTWKWRSDQRQNCIHSLVRIRLPNAPNRWDEKVDPPRSRLESVVARKAEDGSLWTISNGTNSRKI